MEKENVYNVVNVNGLPITGQNYSIPGAFATNATYHDRGINIIITTLIIFLFNIISNVLNVGAFHGGLW